MPISPHGPRVRRFRALLLAWYADTARPLPWRETTDPYRVLVSEVMLQQTQVSRVQPLYHVFLERFPTVADLAAAPVADVLTMWQGLGYNRRALNLHRAARAVVERYGGQIPADLAALRALPGIGDYTARALLAFAFGREASPVDVNVARVLARAVAGEALGRGGAQSLADATVPPEAARAWGIALMDLGAQVCTARRPRCHECPVAAACAWRNRGGEDPAAASLIRARAQGTFAGSDRFHRGRLVDALRQGPVRLGVLAQAAQLDDDERLARIVEGLVADGLAEWTGEDLRLPV